MKKKDLIFQLSNINREIEHLYETSIRGFQDVYHNIDERIMNLIKQIEETKGEDV